ncbi:PTS sugar transporter subunit IIA [Streptomyces sp. NPDC052701]|uniref:PTS sugar transporter subunit IIA n=1 Tax=Streptomyces sp. NPDC052701 TaxID=3155533 RepID=UPI0034223A6A
MNALTTLLSPTAIRLDVDAGDWRAAIRSAGQALADDRVSTDDYTAEMIANVERNGPYIVIAPGLAFAHARPSPAVLRTGMSWIRLARPVPFGHETNDPVTLVVALAAVDSAAHTDAMAALARVLSDPATTEALEHARTPDDVLRLLGGATAAPPASDPDTAPLPASDPDTATAAASGPGTATTAASSPGAATTAGASLHKILTVCGNGVGTSLFLKNTLEQVLDHWGWSTYVTVEATDTISARGKASEAVAVLTSNEIARTLGDVGVPVKVVDDFTSTAEVDAVLRDTYSV